MGHDWPSGLRGVFLRSRGLDGTFGFALVPRSPAFVTSFAPEDDVVNGIAILSGLRAGWASSPCLPTLDNESSGIMALSDNGRGARMTSPIIAL